jgi:hypothetical protein
MDSDWGDIDVSGFFLFFIFSISVDKKDANVWRNPSGTEISWQGH